MSHTFVEEGYGNENSIQRNKMINYFLTRKGYIN